MKNTMKAIVFIVSLFVFLSFYTLVVSIVNPLAGTASETKLLLTAALGLSAAYIVALYSQALVRYFYTNIAIKDATIVMALDIPAFKTTDKLVTYILPMVAVLFSAFRSGIQTKGSIISIASLATLIIIIEILFYLNSKTMRAYITNKGIAIKGLDIRLETTLPLNSPNPSGFYSFDRIDSFLSVSDRVLIYQIYDFGVLTLPCNAEQSKRIKGLLLSNHVPEKKFQ